MKIEILSSKPQALLDKILKDCKDEVLKTWVDRSTSEAKLITHKPEQWYDKALLKFTVSKDSLTVTITYWASKSDPDNATKGYYLGRFTEVLLVHYQSYYSTFTISN